MMQQTELDGGVKIASLSSPVIAGCRWQWDTSRDDGHHMLHSMIPCPVTTYPEPLEI